MRPLPAALVQPMKISTTLSGVVLVDTEPFTDTAAASRAGTANANWRGAPLSAHCQINHSDSAVGAVRGLHFQRPPHAEMKLVRCLRGRVWDVAVDLRAGSPTFLQWHAEELTPGNCRMYGDP